MAAQKKRLSVKEAFQLAQQPHQNQAKLVVALSRTYGAVSGLASDPGLNLLRLETRVGALRFARGLLASASDRNCWRRPHGVPPTPRLPRQGWDAGSDPLSSSAVTWSAQ